ncbi:tyrosine-protein phosphatase non-receptor type substrate 1 isoform X2 [Caretta caretta]|uniref:tyrosine-protein phosphatase non-receptor type substrate 1 isoform X2 n=1 Tax=Caretta caretta TaxID=8467 RepID=UPI003F4B525C
MEALLTALALLVAAAQPTVLLSPQNPEITAGGEKTFSCDVHQFYPQEIDISWLVRKYGSKHERPLTQDICTGVPLAQKGMFTVLSRVTREVSEEDDGSLYICEVRHESLEKPLRGNTTIFVTTPRQYQRDMGFIVGVAAACIVITGVCSIFLTIFYREQFMKVPPQVSLINKPDVIPINEKLKLMCNINGFRPKVISVKWYRRTPQMASSEAPGEASFLLGPREDITDKARQPLETNGKFFSVPSCLTYIPTIPDDGAVFECSIEHSALKSAIWMSTTLSVTARPASLYITSWPQAPTVGEKLILSCVVEKFYPKNITLTWFRNGQLVSDVTQFGPFPCEIDYFSVWSQTEFMLTNEEEGAVYICQIKHSSFGNIEELFYEVNLQGTPPEVLWITTDPSVPVLGEELRLNCRINNFSPNVITVNWFRDGHLLQAGVCHSVSIMGANGLHSIWSVLRVTPGREEEGAVFTCQVTHAALRDSVERSYTLQLPD